MTRTLSKISVSLTALIVMCLFTSAAEASSVIRTGNDVSVSEDQVVEGDFYSAAGTVNLSGVILEDAVVAGIKITVNGEIKQNAFFVGANVDVHGSVGDDLRVVGAEVVIAEPVVGDLFVFGGFVEILSTATIGGDVILYTQEAVVKGVVGGNIIGAVGNLKVDANVKGDIDVTVNKLTLGERANVEGSITYVSSQLLDRALEATTAKDPIRNDPIISKDQSGHYSWLLATFVLLFSTLAWYLVSRPSLNIIVKRAVVKSPRPLLLGTVTIIVLPIAAGVLIISVIGSVVGAVLLFAYALLIALSLIGLVAVLGKFFMFAFSKEEKETSLISLLTGVVGLILLSMLPVIGVVILVLLFLLTLGAMVDVLLRPKLED